MKHTMNFLAVVVRMLTAAFQAIIPILLSKDTAEKLANTIHELQDAATGTDLPQAWEELGQAVRDFESRVPEFESHVNHKLDQLGVE